MVLGLPTIVYLAAAFGHEGARSVGKTAEEYVSFVLLLLALYTISGGIYLTGNLIARPRTNLTFLAGGAVLASLIGTMGASALLIRPLLRANSERKHARHTVVLFIFAVSNIGGMLTPLGDPPLFLGFLRESTVRMDSRALAAVASRGRTCARDLSWYRALHVPQGAGGSGALRHVRLRADEDQGRTQRGVPGPGHGHGPAFGYLHARRRSDTVPVPGGDQLGDTDHCLAHDRPTRAARGEQFQLAPHDRGRWSLPASSPP
jgi:Putative citrate transport